jgi:predicted transcriptional regulator
MAGNNEDFLRRLQQDGRDDLLEKIETGELSVYRAALIMGYRKRKTAPSREGQITYHWTRASAAEKKQFLKRNFQSVAPLVQKIIAEHHEKQAEKPVK